VTTSLARCRGVCVSKCGFDAFVPLLRRSQNNSGEREKDSESLISCVPNERPRTPFLLSWVSTEPASAPHTDTDPFAASNVSEIRLRVTPVLPRTAHPEPVVSRRDVSYLILKELVGGPDLSQMEPPAALVPTGWSVQGRRMIGPLNDLRSFRRSCCEESPSSQDDPRIAGTRLSRRADLTLLPQRERFSTLRISSWCLTSTDSATTERAPPGPTSRTTVASRWRNRTATSRIAQSYQDRAIQNCRRI
jgi:hypothetical protein